MSKKTTNDTGAGEYIPPPDQFVMYTHGWLKKFTPMLSESERKVYDALAIHFGPGKDGLVWPKAKTIAELAGFSTRGAALKAINGLRDKGLIDVIDWPVVIDQKPGGAFKEIGGGAERGRSNVYMMLHVDERGYHRAEQCRASIRDLERADEERVTAMRDLQTMALEGTTWGELKSYVSTKFPNGGNPDALIRDEDESVNVEKLRDADLVIVSIDSTLMGPTLWPIYELEAKYPDADRPSISLLWTRHERDHEAIGRGAFQVWREKEEALRQTGLVDAVLLELQELSRTAKDAKLSTAFRCGKNPEFLKRMPKTAEAMRKTRVIPHYLWSMARHIAHENGTVTVEINEHDEPIAIEARPPDKWTDPETAKWATLTQGKLTDEHRADFEATLERVRAAQQRMIDDFIRGVSHEDSDSMPGGVRNTLVAKFFNDWLRIGNGDRLVPFKPLTAEDVRKTRERQQRESEPARTMTA